MLNLTGVVRSKTLYFLCFLCYNIKYRVRNVFGLFCAIMVILSVEEYEKTEHQKMAGRIFAGWTRDFAGS